MVGGEQGRSDMGTPVYIQFVAEILNSGSAPFYALATDGQRYLCKSPNSPHDVEAVVNEVAVGLIGERLNAHVRPWRILRVPESLKGTLIESESSVYSLDKPVFGSRFLPNANLDYIEGEIPGIEKDDNVHHVPKIISLWLLCNPQKDIQILLEEKNEDSIWSIDHGFWFDSLPTPWNLPEVNEPCGRPPIPRIRKAIPRQCWNDALYGLTRLNAQLKDDLFEALPPEWEVSREKTDRLISYVLKRKQYARETLEKLKEQTEGR